jgi:hypothetical protein
MSRDIGCHSEGMDWLPCCSSPRALPTLCTRTPFALKAYAAMPHAKVFPAPSTAAQVLLQTPQGAPIRLGHLPAAISAHLSPLLDSGEVTLSVATPTEQVLGLLAGRAASAPLEVEVALAPEQEGRLLADGGGGGGGGGGGCGVGRGGVAAAVAACEQERLQQEAGQVLAANVQVMLEQVR